MFLKVRASAPILNFLGLALALGIVSSIAYAQEMPPSSEPTPIPSPSTEESPWTQLNNRVQSLNKEFTSHLKQKGLEVIPGPTPTSPVHIHLPSGIQGKLVMTVTKNVTHLDVRVTQSTCASLSRPIRCTTDLVFYTISGLKVVDEDNNSLKVLKKSKEQLDFADFNLVSANYFPFVESRKPSSRFALHPKFKCENFDFLPAGNEVTVLNWGSDGGDVINPQTGQTEPRALRQIPGFKGPKLSSTVMDIHFLPIKNRNESGGDYLPTVNSRFQWSVWDERDQVACKVDFSIENMSGILDMFMLSKRESQDMDLHRMDLIGKNVELESGVRRLNFCANEAFDFFSANEAIFYQLVEGFSPTLQFLDRFGYLKRFLSTNSTDTADNTLDIFSWESPENPNCNTRVWFQWPD